MTKTETYLNSPLKCCQTCAYRLDGKRGNGDYDKCIRFHFSCPTAVTYFCTSELTEWRPVPPKPPRRSLRQWLYDLLLA